MAGALEQSQECRGWDPPCGSGLNTRQSSQGGPDVGGAAGSLKGQPRFRRGPGRKHQTLCLRVADAKGEGLPCVG